MIGYQKGDPPKYIKGTLSSLPNEPICLVLFRTLQRALAQVYNLLNTLDDISHDHLICLYKKATGLLIFQKENPFLCLKSLTSFHLQ